MIRQHTPLSAAGPRLRFVGAVAAIECQGRRRPPLPALPGAAVFGSFHKKERPFSALSTRRGGRFGCRRLEAHTGRDSVRPVPPPGDVRVCLFLEDGGEVGAGGGPPSPASPGGATERTHHSHHGRSRPLAWSWADWSRAGHDVIAVTAAPSRRAAPRRRAGPGGPPGLGRAPRGGGLWTIRDRYVTDP